MRAAAREHRVALSTVQRWVGRTRGQRLDRTDVSDRPAGCRRAANRTPAGMERAVASARRHLLTHSALGEHGAAAIRSELSRRGQPSPPSTRTVGRILDRLGLLDGPRRQRRPAPPRGWYLPAVAAGKAELDSFDIVEGLAIAGGCRVEVLNGISLHGHLAAAWPTAGAVTAKFAVECLVSHWSANGRPAFAQFDNDTIFQGAHHVPDAFGRVIRLCQQLGVVPVFAPPREMGFQASIERYNLLWQQNVWQRFQHRSLRSLQRRSEAFVQAHRDKHAPLMEAVHRRPMPRRWRLDLNRPLRGTTIFIRRTDEAGRIRLIGRTHRIDPKWPNRLVRAEVDFDQQVIRCYSLRRRDPEDQPLLRTIPYARPTARFLDR